jgi:UDP-N-acetylglucosamine acyltransferase
MNIHPSAIIHSEAQLADDVEVQAFSIIGPKVTIGAGSCVGPHCVITGDTVIGERNRFFSGAQIGILSQDLKHNEDLLGRTLIGNDNTFREFVTITGSTIPTKEDYDRMTSVADGCLLMTYVHLGHDCHIGNSNIFAAYVGLAGHVDTENNVNIGGQTGVHQDVCLGCYAFVGGMTRTTKDVPPYMIVEGSPCRCIGPNTIGLERNGFDREARARVKELYKITYRSKLNTTQALEEIDRSVDESEERNHFVEFVRQSARGIAK